MSGANESDGQRFKRGPRERAQGALLGYRLGITVGSVSILGVESSGGTCGLVPVWLGRDCQRVVSDNRPGYL